jgi:mRNA interferase MazF
MSYITRGDVYYAELSDTIGSEQSGGRPVLVVQNNTGNKFSPTVIIAAITSKREKSTMSTHISVDSALPRKSIILLEQLRTIDKRRLRYYITTLENDTMEQVDKALQSSLGIGNYSFSDRQMFV